MNKYFENEDVIELYNMLKDSIIEELKKRKCKTVEETIKQINIIEKQLREDLEEAFNLIYIDYREKEGI